MVLTSPSVPLSLPFFLPGIGGGKLSLAQCGSAVEPESTPFSDMDRLV